MTEDEFRTRIGTGDDANSEKIGALKIHDIFLYHYYSFHDTDDDITVSTYIAMVMRRKGDTVWFNDLFCTKGLDETSDGMEVNPKSNDIEQGDYFEIIENLFNKDKGASARQQVLERRPEFFI